MVNINCISEQRAEGKGDDVIKTSWLNAFFTPSTLRLILFFFFVLSILFFPFGEAFRVIFPIACLPFLSILYWKDWNNSTLRHLPIRWLFGIFVISFFIQLLASEWIFASWVSIYPNFFRGFILVFVGMEVVRSEYELRWLIIAFAGAFFLEGLDGVWQAITGFDCIKHTALIDGRLTGSLGTYRVGNYMSIIVFPAMGIWMFIPTKSIVFRGVLTILLLSPGIVLWVGAFTRIGYFACIVGLYILWLCIWTKRVWWKIIVPPVIFVSFLTVFGISRLSWKIIFTDPRVELWTKALRVGLENFWFGSGSSTFILALQKYGFCLNCDLSMDLGHPHNMYIQFFVDGGIVGLFSYLFFLFGVTYWSWSVIQKGVQEELLGQIHGEYWRFTSFFWAGWVAYLCTGCGAHDFYRTWWFSTAATILGIVVGACQWGTCKESSK